MRNLVKFVEAGGGLVWDFAGRQPRPSRIHPRPCRCLWQPEFYIDKCGKTTDVLNWHTYAQPPSTVLAEARYWGQRADGKLAARTGQGDVHRERCLEYGRQPVQLSDGAGVHLPLEPRIIANFQYCMEMRNEGGPYCFGVLQPEGSFPPITTTTGPGATCAGGSCKPSPGRRAGQLVPFPAFHAMEDNYHDRPLLLQFMTEKACF